MKGNLVTVVVFVMRNDVLRPDPRKLTGWQFQVCAQ